jgi:hypothetical protein
MSLTNPAKASPKIEDRAANPTKHGKMLRAGAQLRTSSKAAADIVLIDAST